MFHSFEANSSETCCWSTFDNRKMYGQSIIGVVIDLGKVLVHVCVCTITCLKTVNSWRKPALLFGARTKLLHWHCNSVARKGNVGSSCRWKGMTQGKS